MVEGVGFSENMGKAAGITKKKTKDKQYATVDFHQSRFDYIPKELKIPFNSPGKASLDWSSPYSVTFHFPKDRPNKI